MGQNRRRRPTGARRATFAAFALILGGGGLVAANVYASATEDDSAQLPNGTRVTIDCPDVGSRLTTVPDETRADVDKELALLDEQIAGAYQQLKNSAQAVQEDRGFADNAVMNPLKEKRTATIERIAIAIDRSGDRPEELDSLAACTLRTVDDGAGDGQNGGQEGGQDQGGDVQDGQNQGDGQDQDGGQNQGQGGNGPVAADFADITSVQPNVQTPQAQADASRGTFTTSCGVNAEGLFNSDNVIVAPGVSNGAHHFHDYVGNQANNAFAGDDDLANGDTSCVDQGDKSSYYWPVLRLQNGTQEQDANSPGGGTEGNAGEIVTPKQVTLTFVGNPRSKVTAMPRLLRIITGDAKAFVNGPANANASWSCTGFEDRQLKDKYPLCPQGSDVVRTFKFQSCWDGRNIDSANHRTHVAFAAADGTCSNGFQAIPQLVQRIVYDVDAPSLGDGGRTTPLFAVDSFPEQLHKPVTDHGDFINVFDEGLMKEMVDCINGGRNCGAGAGDGSGSGEEEPQQPAPSTEAPQDEPTGNGDEQGSEPPATAPATEPTDNGDNGGNGDNGANGAGQNDQPRVYSSPTARSTAAAPQSGGSDEEVGTAAVAPQQDRTTAAAEAPDGNGDQSEPQAVQGDLAETGTNLWPAAAGGSC